MTAELRCPCGRWLRVNQEDGARQGRCPACGHVLDIPVPEVATPPAGPSAATLSAALTDEPGRPLMASTALTDTPPAEEPLDGPTPEAPDLVRPNYRLSPPGQIGVIAFLGGPMAGVLLMARNYARLGRLAASWLTVLIGLTVTAVAVGLSTAHPEGQGLSPIVLAAPLWLGTYLAARLLQGSAYEEHLRRGGEQLTGLVVLGALVLGIGLTLGGAWAFALLYESALGDQRLAVSPVEEVLYSRDVTEAEANTLARVFRQEGIFNGQGEKSVKLGKEGDTWVISVILLDGFDDPQTIAEFRALAARVSQALGGRPVRIELCDQWLKPKRTLTPVAQP
jgi:hypothetical protein